MPATLPAHHASATPSALSIAARRASTVPAAAHLEGVSRRARRWAVAGTDACGTLTGPRPLISFSAFFHVAVAYLWAKMDVGSRLA